MLYIDKFGVEVRGIERIKPEDRSARSVADLLDAATMYITFLMQSMHVSDCVIGG